MKVKLRNVWISFVVVYNIPNGVFGDYIDIYDMTQAVKDGLSRNSSAWCASNLRTHSLFGAHFDLPIHQHGK